MNDETVRAFDTAAARARAYLEGLPARPVPPAASAVDALGAPRRPAARDRDRCGEGGRAARRPRVARDDRVRGRALLRVRDRWFAPRRARRVGPRDRVGPERGARTASPAASRLEEIALGWVVPLLGLPAGTGGSFVTGATMANFTALGDRARRGVLGRPDGRAADGLSARRP